MKASSIRIYLIKFMELVDAYVKDADGIAGLYDVNGLNLSHLKT